MEKNVEENEEIFKLANSLGEYKRDILDLFAKGPDAKSEEELLYQAEEKVKDSVVILKKIFKSHENYKFEGLKKKELKERSLMAESFGYILNIASIFGYPISSEMFRNAIRTDIPIVLFDEELQEKVNDSLNADSEFISLVNEVKKKIVDEINWSQLIDW